MNEQMTQEKLNHLFSISDVVKHCKFACNGTGARKAKKLIKESGLCTAHFDRGRKNRKYEIVDRTCPVCDNTFKVRKGSPKEQMTCSYSCANSFFRSGSDNPNWKNDSTNYRRTCWQNHKKECVICKEDKIVTVHHYDLDHHNNDASNLVPLCPTHHSYIHSSHKELVIKKIDVYVENWKKNICV